MSKEFKGIKTKTTRYIDKFHASTDAGVVIMSVTSPDYRADAAMSVSPATARQIAAELVRLADLAEAEAPIL